MLDDDFNTPEALALFHEWRARGDWPSLRFGLSLFGLGSLADVAQAPAEVVALAERRRDQTDLAALHGDGPAADTESTVTESRGLDVEDRPNALRVPSLAFEVAFRRPGRRRRLHLGRRPLLARLNAYTLPPGGGSPASRAGGSMPSRPPPRRPGSWTIQARRCATSGSS